MTSDIDTVLEALAAQEDTAKIDTLEDSRSRLMSPLKIRILLHYHTSSSDYGPTNFPIYDETMRELVLDGFLFPSPSPAHHPLFRATPMFNAYCTVLEQTPYPINKWLDPRTNKPIESRFAFDLRGDEGSK